MRIFGKMEGLLPQPGAHGYAKQGVVLQHQMRGPFHLPPGPAGFSFALRQSLGVELAAGHRLELVTNGHIFDVLAREISQARRSVHILVFIWRPCAASDRLVEALLERARAGVDVRVVVDPIGSEEVMGPRDFDEGLEKRLSDGGCEVHYYQLLSGRAFRRLLGREHQKLCIVDGRVGVTGGFGIWEKWEGDGLSKDHWRDTHVRVEGPAVADMQLAFARAWQESGGDLLPADTFPETLPAGPSRAAFVASQGGMGMSDAERMCRLVFAAATRRLWISNAYFSPPKALLEQLSTKRKQGVDVRVLMPGPVHDVKIIRASQRSLYVKLLEDGIRLYEYQPSMMHAKTILVDDWLSVIGSTNLDALSLTKLGEGSLVSYDLGLAQKMEALFEADLEHSREVTLENVGRTGPLKRLARRVTQLVGRDL